MSCAESELSELHSAVPPVGTAVSACQPQPSVKLPVRPQCPPYPPTRRYDDVIRDVPRVVKIVDDALLYDETIEEAFFHTFDYLTLGAQNGIVFNKSKFQFCQENVDFGGLHLIPDGIAPSATMLMAIQDFPTPANITDARSWFDLVNQVAWAYSLGHVMQPFRELVKPNSKFQWSQSLEDAFQHSKSVIVDLVKEGITTSVAVNYRYRRYKSI